MVQYLTQALRHGKGGREKRCVPNTSSPRSFVFAGRPLAAPPAFDSFPP
jgi:hypothetical protein